jgi:hypothetical protein
MNKPIRKIGTVLYLVQENNKRVFVGDIVRPSGPVQMLACKDHGICTCPLIEEWFQKQGYMMALCLGAARALFPGKTVGFAGKPMGDDGFFPFNRVVEDLGDDSPALIGIAVADYDMTSFEAEAQYRALTDSHERMRAPENEAIGDMIDEIRNFPEPIMFVREILGNN